MSDNKNGIYTSFLGTGWSFPPTFSPDRRGVEMTSDEEDIERSLQILLSTAPGERILQPDFGCNLDALVFDPMSTSMKTYVTNLISRAILHHEPRITLKSVKIIPGTPEEGRMDIAIDYVVRTTNSRYNFVYPFYVEGPGIK